MASNGKQTYGLPILVDQPVAADPAALTFVTITDSSGGTPSDTVPAQTGSYVQADVRNGFAALARAANRNGADIVALRTTVLALTDALQAYGLVASS